MASIRKRTTKKGKVSFHVQIRLKDYEPLTFTCYTYKEALELANEIEQKRKSTRLKKRLGLD